MEQETPRAPELPQPLRAVASHLSRLPGAGHVGRVAGTALDTLGAVSPRGRRIAVYTGAGVLGVAGLVEWPVALTGAAVAWLTRPRDDKETADGTRHTPPRTRRGPPRPARVWFRRPAAPRATETRTRTATPAPATASPPPATTPPRASSPPR
ncbi:hypothetical protein ACFQZ0_04615 [Streptomyces erythrogriseus]